MIYLDTNVVIAFVDELDPNHGRALKFLRRLKGDRVVSELTLVELASVYSRAGLRNPLSLALYSVEVVGAKVVRAGLGEVLRQAFKLAPTLRLRTLDLIHVATCKVIGADLFATFDKDIVAKRDAVREVGVEVVTYGERAGD